MASSWPSHVGRDDVVVGNGSPLLSLAKPKQEDRNNVGIPPGQIGECFDVPVRLRAEGILSALAWVSRQ